MKKIVEQRVTTSLWTKWITGRILFRSVTPVEKDGTGIMLISRGYGHEKI